MTKTTVKAALDALGKAFADGGVCSRIVLLEQLFTMKLSDCMSMEDFVNMKTRRFGLKSEMRVSLLMRMLNECKLMVLGIENPTPQLTVDYVNNLLLQEMLSNQMY